MSHSLAVTDGTVLPKWVPLFFLFLSMTFDSWRCVTYSIRSDALLRLTFWSPRRLILPLTLQSMNTYLYAWEKPGFLSFSVLTNNRIFPLFSLWEHVASIVFLATLSHFNPSSCETVQKGEGKKDGSVSEEAHGSWGSLITVMTERDRGWKTWEMERSRHGRNLSRDEMNQPIQRPLLCCWYEAVTSHPEGLSVGEAAASWSKGRGSECITLWPTNAYGLCIELLPV